MITKHSDPFYNTPWICFTSSNVHVANDKAWFTNYTSFETSLTIQQPGERGAELAVFGIGDVSLHIVKSIERGQKDFKVDFVLRDVLFAPHNTNNIFACIPAMGYKEDFGKERFRDVGTNAVVGVVDVVGGRRRLWLKGQGKGESSLDGGIILRDVTWSEKEKIRWEMARKKLIDPSEEVAEEEKSSTTGNEDEEPRVSGNNIWSVLGDAEA